MRWVCDQTHRFRMRPDYADDELDQLCEAVVSNSLRKKYGEVVFHLRTDDLRDLLERETESLDVRADFANEASEVEGLTEFRRGRKPVVKIAPRLVEEPNLENRLRAAFAHTYSHVLLHNFLFQTEEGLSLSLFEGPPDPHLRIHRCHRDSITPHTEEDWMEWQAGYAGGALLMPIGPLIALVRDFRHERDLDHAALSDRSLDGSSSTPTSFTSRTEVRTRWMEISLSAQPTGCIGISPSASRSSHRCGPCMPRQSYGKFWTSACAIAGRHGSSILMDATRS